MFLNYELSLCGYPNISESVIDTLIMAREIFPNQKNKLGDLCERYNISDNRNGIHGALADAKLLADVYIIMNELREKEIVRIINYNIELIKNIKNILVQL